MRTHRIRLVTIALLSAPAAGLPAHAALAADCAPVVKAELATLEAPAFRQYMAAAGKDERLLSITLGDSVYMALAPGRWQKQDRTDIVAMGKDAAADSVFSDCQALGAEAVGGGTAAVYAFTRASKSQSFPASQGKVWIGADGLLRRQATARGTLRYEYDNVKAPVP